MADTDDMLSDLLAKNADLFAAYGEWSAGQIMLLAGTVDDPNSFDKDGGKTGALGYYPVVNVSGQTLYIPCIARLKEIALGGANAETLAEVLGTANTKLALVDQATANAAAKAAYAGQQGDAAKSAAAAIGDVSAAVATATDAKAAAVGAAGQAGDALQQLNAARPQLLNRANHTGTQAIDTIDAFRLERRYAYGKLVMHARVDPSYGLGDAITAEGVHLANYGIRVNGMSWTRNPLDGVWDLDGTQLLKSAPSVTFSDGSSITPSRTRYYNGLAVRWGVAGPDGVTSPMFVLEDGTVVAGKLVSPSILTPAGVVALPFQTLNLASGGTIDSTGLRFYNGRAVRKAWADSDGRASIIELDDGTVVIPKLSSPAVITDPSGFSFPAVNFSTGAAIVTTTGDRYYAGKKIKKAWTDNGLGASLIELEDGTIAIPKLSSPALDLAGGAAALETAAYVFHEAIIAGAKQLRRTSKTSGVRSQATATGNNFAPRLSYDGSKVVYLSDRSGTKESWYQLLDGSLYGTSIEHPVAPYTLITGLGDSIMATGWIDAIPPFFGTTLSTPSSVSNVGAATAGGGIGSQRSIQIAARYGACGYGGLPDLTCSLVNNTMVAGSNQLTAISIPLISRAADAINPGGDGNGARRTLRARLFGVTGLLVSVQKSAADSTTVPAVPGFNVDSYTYTFTPDAGQTLPAVVPAGSVLVIDPEIRQDTVLVVHVGRNDVGARTGWQADVKLALAAIVAAYKPLIRRMVIIGVTNARNEPAGSSAYNQIVALNQELAALYPDSFLDVRPFYNAGEATDIPNAAFSDDGLHPNGPGRLNGFTIPVRDQITRNGWYLIP